MFDVFEGNVVSVTKGNSATIDITPIDAESGDHILEVFSVSDADTIQRITTESDIYTRQKSSGVWGSWYKFTGTEVSA